MKVSDEQMRMIEAVQRKLGFPQRSMVLHEMIAFRFHKLFPTYSANTSEDPLTTDTEKLQTEVKRQISKDKIKLEAKDNVKAEICSALGGEVYLDNGKKMCRWTNYVKPVGSSMVMKNKQTSRLDMLSNAEELLAGQYFPSKEEVEKFLDK